MSQDRRSAMPSTHCVALLPCYFQPRHQKPTIWPYHSEQQLIHNNYCTTRCLRKTRHDVHYTFGNRRPTVNTVSLLDSQGKRPYLSPKISPHLNCVATLPCTINGKYRGQLTDQTNAVVSCAITACNYFSIWAGLSLSINVCVTSHQNCRPTKNYCYYQPDDFIGSI